MCVCVDVDVEGRDSEGVGVVERGKGEKRRERGTVGENGELLFLRSLRVRVEENR